MKKIISLVILSGLSYYSISQDNTLPTTGNVGVGTLTPTTRLDVNGSVKIDSSLVVNDSIRVNKSIRVLDKVYIEGKTVMGDNAVAQQNFKVLGNANFEGNMNIDGTLKIPNTSTLSSTNFEDGNFDFVLLNENGAARKGGYADLASKITNSIYNTDFPFPIDYCDLYLNNGSPTWSNGLNKIFVQCPQVLVGINTTEPRSSLDVHGTTYTNSMAIGMDPTLMQGKLHIKHGGTIPSSKIMIIENDTKRLLSLENSGLLRAREIKIDTETWPDYVFEKNYALMPLKEVEQYINLNGHLPNIPSAQTMTEEGINLAEMNRLLLEKIEELTLHIIEQEKRIEALEKK